MGDTTNQKVFIWARGKTGQQVGTGECWDLANAALKQAGAKSSADLGSMEMDADYVWGDEVQPDEPQHIAAAGFTLGFLRHPNLRLGLHLRKANRLFGFRRMESER